MLTDLRIENFRGIRSLALDCPGQINLIVGRNNTGKTTLIEAIRILISGDPRHLRRTADRHLARPVLRAELSFRNAFFHADEAAQILIQGSIRDLALKADVKLVPFGANEEAPVPIKISDDQEFVPWLTPPKDVLLTVQVGDSSAAFRVILPTNLIMGQPTAYFVSRTFAGAPFPPVPKVIWLGTRREESDDSAEWFSEVYRAGGAPHLIKLLSSIEPDLKSLVVLAPSSKYEFTAGGVVLEVEMLTGPPSPLEQMGEGFTSIISAVTAVAAAKDGLCLIDEIENGIHYSVLSSVWSAIGLTAKENDTQVWATTHSMDCIAAAHEAFMDNPEALKVHRLERRPNGEIRAHTFDHEMLGHALETGLEVR